MDLQFKRIEIDTIGELMPFYALRHNNTCDSVFLESFIWKEYYNVRYAVWENRALLWLMENNGKSFSAMPLCREEDLPDAFHAIEQYFNEELGYPLVINLADEYAVKYLNLPEDKYLVEEQVDSKDYLYTGEAMRTLAGKKLHKKKNRVNAFKREYEGRYEYRRLCCSDSHEVWEFLDKWREQKGEDVEEHLDYEVRGIHDILKNCSDLYIRMGGVYIDGRLEAFTIGSYNPVENMAVIHIEKANPEINGLYQYINQQFLLEEFPDVDWVNREDDMGIEGLRRAKMSYMPADYARKYLVEQLLDGKKGYHWAEQIGNTQSGSRMEYLTDADKGETVRLWHGCFPEDSESFIRYYYTEKTKDNRILVKKDNGLILSMVHYNPYRIRMKDRKWELDYLVAVATEETRRREGHFRDMFLRMLADQQKEGKPITYLVPVNPEVYAPLGFTFIGTVPLMELQKEAEDRLEKCVCRDIPEDCELAAEYMEQWLSDRYEMYTHRDSAYVSRLIKELASENGSLYFLRDGGWLVGLLAVWGLEQKEQRLLYAEDAYTVKTGEKNWNMARLTNAEALLGAFHLKQAGEVSMILEIEDPILEANRGRFLWKLDEKKSEAVRLSAFCEVLENPAAANAPKAVNTGDAKMSDYLRDPDLQVTAEELVGWLMGYRKAADIWQEADAAALEKLEQVDTVNGVFLDEIV